MKFLFDNNLPPSLARGIAELSKFESDVETVIALRDKFKPGERDEQWLAALIDEGGWNVLSLDGFKKSPAEKELIRRRGLTVFVLDPQWSKPYWEQTANLVKWWPKILGVARLTSKTALRVPWHFTNKSTFQQQRL